MTFSQRMGFTSAREHLQIDDIDSKLKIKLWNLLTEFFIKIDASNKKAEIYKELWTDFFDGRIDEMPIIYNPFQNEMVEKIKNIYFNQLAWYQIYDLIEFLAKIDEEKVNFQFTSKTNFILKQEMSGYRFVDNKIIQTTNELEIESIEIAVQDSAEISSVNTHLKTALELLSNRESPDYRNSIKESISAVEAMCCKITGKPNATLGNALNEIEKSHNLHKALKASFSALYGYTSDAGGIRHSLLEDDIAIEFEDAKFMLVSCSAFVNYLLEKTQK